MNYCYETKITNYDYQLVSKKAMRLNLFISIGFFILVYLLANIESAVIISLLLFVSQYFKLSTRTKYFVVRLEINANSVNILYKENGVEKQLKGFCEDFEFKKGMSISRARDPYLSIYYRGKLVIKQYIETDFDLKEKDFDEAIQSLKSNN